MNGTWGVITSHLNCGIKISLLRVPCFCCCLSVYSRHSSQRDPVKMQARSCHTVAWPPISLSVKTKVLTLAHNALHDLRSPIVSLRTSSCTSPCSLCSNCAGLHSIPKHARNPPLLELYNCCYFCPDYSLFGYLCGSLLLSFRSLPKCCLLGETFLSL